ncbi:kinase-like domain-containing protein [Pilobolus umbonatus]|nr:kinase-like domain-containing protein [Pilobolus umbonatus]
MSPCGTIGYTAPEIVRDQWYSSSVDLWALGCVLYTMLCGFPPFFDENTEGLTRKVVIGEYEFMSPWWDHVSSEAKDLVSHLLHINPKKRYTIQQCLLHPWMTKKLELRIPPPLPTTSVVIETAQSIPRYTPPSVQSHLLSIKKAFDVSTRVHLKETESPLLLDLNQATLISKRKKSKGGH